MKSKIVLFFTIIVCAASDLYWLDHTEPVTDPLRIYGAYAWT